MSLLRRGDELLLIVYDINRKTKFRTPIYPTPQLSEMSQLRENVQPILPPPPSSSKRGHLERQQTVPASSASSTSSPATVLTSKTPPPQGSVHWFDKETENLFNEGELSSLAMKAAANSSADKDKDGVSFTQKRKK